MGWDMKIALLLAMTLNGTGTISILMMRVMVKMAVKLEQRSMEEITEWDMKITLMYGTGIPTPKVRVKVKTLVKIKQKMERIMEGDGG